LRKARPLGNAKNNFILFQELLLNFFLSRVERQVFI
jgi:hypothetical protein